MVLLPLVALICSMKISNYNVITTNLDSIFMVRAIHLAGLNLSLIIQTIFKKFYFYSWNGQREYLIAHLDSICWKPLPYNFFGAIGVTSGVDSIMWFSLDDMCMWFWEAAPIIPYTTGIVLDTYFQHQNKKSSIGFLFLCKGWYCIKHFSNWCESERNEFQFFLYRLIMFGLKTTYTCQQVEIAICNQLPLVVLIAQKTLKRGLLTCWL